MTTEEKHLNTFSSQRPFPVRAAHALTFQKDLHGNLTAPRLIGCLTGVTAQVLLRDPSHQKAEVAPPTPFHDVVLSTNHGPSLSVPCDLWLRMAAHLNDSDNGEKQSADFTQTRPADSASSGITEGNRAVAVSIFYIQCVFGLRSA